jgi:hypothetical protein
LNGIVRVSDSEYRRPGDNRPCLIYSVLTLVCRMSRERTVRASHTYKNTNDVH